MNPPLRLQTLREVLRSYIINKIPNVKLNGHSIEHLPGLLNVSFSGIDADSLLLELPNVALSSGSACNSALRSPSHVLKAIGLSDA